MNTPTSWFLTIRRHCVLLAVLSTASCSSTTPQRTETATTAMPVAPAAKHSKPARHATKKKSKHKSKPKAKRKAETKAEPEAVVAAAAKPPQPPESSRIVLPIKVSFDALAEHIDELVPRTDAQGWTPITKDGESPRAEVKYQLWRDPVQVAFSDHTLHITVPVHYAANVRAQVKNPFSKHSWISIAKNETWGTRQDPQHLTATIDAELSVDGAWQIKSTMRVAELEHGKPPSGKICKNAGIKICVSKADVAPKVRKGIDAYLRPRLQKALAKVDARVQNALDLQGRAQLLWGVLQTPQRLSLPAAQAAWLVVVPEAVGIGALEKDGSDLRIDLSLMGRIAVVPGKRPEAVEQRALPALSVVDGPVGIFVSADLRVPTATLSAVLNRELKGLRFGGGGQRSVSIVRAQVLARADKKHPHRMRIELALDGALRAKIELHGELAYDAAAQRVSVGHFDLTEESQRLLTQKLEGFDQAAMRKQLAAKAHWDLAAESAPLERAVGAALSLAVGDQLRVSGELKQVELGEFAMEADALWAAATLGGALEVRYAPR